MQVLCKETAAFDANVASNAKATLYFPKPVRIVSCGVIGLDDEHATYTVSFDKNETTGAAVSVDSDIAAIVVPANAQNTITYDELTDDGVELAGGDSVVIGVTVDPAEATTCVAFVEYVPLDEQFANVSKATVSA